MTVEKSEQELLEGKLDTALTEAETKVTKALESFPDRREESEKEIWAAAEATEFASLVYALTYSLEESSGNTGGKREIVETLTVLTAASQDLKTVHALGRLPTT
jgi:hypothetical protein